MLTFVYNCYFHSNWTAVSQWLSLEFRSKWFWSDRLLKVVFSKSQWSIERSKNEKTNFPFFPIFSPPTHLKIDPPAFEGCVLRIISIFTVVYATLSAKLSNKLHFKVLVTNFITPTSCMNANLTKTNIFFRSKHQKNKFFTFFGFRRGFRTSENWDILLPLVDHQPL